MSKAEKATRTLINYLQVSYHNAGEAWTNEHSADIENAVQDIIKAAQPEPDATEQLLQKYRDVAAIRYGEILVLKKERDLAQKALNESCQTVIKDAHIIKTLVAERDDLRDFVRSFLRTTEQDSDGNFVMLTDDIDPLARLAVSLVETGE